MVRSTGWLPGCRELFGDERDDYAEAVKRHYEAGPPPDWQVRFVSTYASTHPYDPSRPPNGRRSRPWQSPRDGSTSTTSRIC